MNKLLEVKNLYYSYPNLDVLHNVNLSIESEKFISIVGASGCGKSTLLNILAGMIKDYQGDIIAKNENFSQMMAYMLQDDLLLEHKRIIDNVILPCALNGKELTAARSEAMELLKKFELDRFYNYYPSQISGGMRQKIAFLRTYMMKREIFLLDEAFSALDAISKIELHDWYLAMCKKLKLTSLLVTHDINEAIKLSDTIIVMNNSKETSIAQVFHLKNKDKINIQELYNQIVGIINQ